MLLLLLMCNSKLTLAANDYESSLSSRIPLQQMMGSEIDAFNVGKKEEHNERLLTTSQWIQQTSAAQWSARSGLASVVIGNNITVLGGGSAGSGN